MLYELISLRGEKIYFSIYLVIDYTLTGHFINTCSFMQLLNQPNRGGSRIICKNKHKTNYGVDCHYYCQYYYHFAIVIITVFQSFCLSCIAPLVGVCFLSVNFHICIRMCSPSLQTLITLLKQLIALTNSQSPTKREGVGKLFKKRKCEILKKQFAQQLHLHNFPLTPSEVNYPSSLFSSNTFSVIYLFIYFFTLTTQVI